MIGSRAPYFTSRDSYLLIMIKKRLTVTTKKKYLPKETEDYYQAFQLLSEKYYQNQASAVSEFPPPIIFRFLFRSFRTGIPHTRLQVPLKTMVDGSRAFKATARLGLGFLSINFPFVKFSLFWRPPVVLEPRLITNFMNVFKEWH